MTNEPKRYTAKEYEDHKSVFVADAECPGSVFVQFHIIPGHSYDSQCQRVLEYTRFLNTQDQAMKKAAHNVTIVSAVAQRMLGVPDENTKPEEPTP